MLSKEDDFKLSESLFSTLLLVHATVSTATSPQNENILQEIHLVIENYKRNSQNSQHLRNAILVLAFDVERR